MNFKYQGKIRKYWQELPANNWIIPIDRNRDITIQSLENAND